LIKTIISEILVSILFNIVKFGLVFNHVREIQVFVFANVRVNLSFNF
jgi:hypothetical protein